MYFWTCMQVSLCGLDVSHLCIILHKIYSCVVLFKMFTLLQIKYTYIYIHYYPLYKKLFILDRFKSRGWYLRTRSYRRRCVVPPTLTIGHRGHWRLRLQAFSRMWICLTVSWQLYRQSMRVTRSECIMFSNNRKPKLLLMHMHNRISRTGKFTGFNTVLEKHGISY